MVTELLTRLGVDPGILTVHAMSSRVLEFAWANLNIPNAIALIGAAFYVIRYFMRTIVPLRAFGIVGDFLFIVYGALANSVTTFFLYLLLLPINSARLYQMLKLVKKARLSADGALSIEWLEPYMTRRNYKQGSVLFREGDKAEEMFVTVTGRFLVKKLGVELPPGTLFGEIGFLSPKNRRTQTIECIEGGEVMVISYDKLLELFFMNPEFSYYFLRLSSQRLLENMGRLERAIEENKLLLDEQRKKATG